MVLKYSKYGLIDGLIFLFPAFPIFSLLPMLGIAKVLGDHFSDCEAGYRITYLASLILAIIIDLIFITSRLINKNTDQVNKFAFFSFNLLLYLLVNSFGFVAFVGTNAACHGDGQVILGCMFSGPITSLIIFINGIIIDLAVHLKKRRYGHKQ